MPEKKEKSDRVRPVRVLTKQQQEVLRVSRFAVESEQTKKTNQMLIDALRHNGKGADNLILRVMQMQTAPFAETAAASSSSSSSYKSSSTRSSIRGTDPSSEDLVNPGSNKLLSRGASPSSIPALYPTIYPTSKDWTEAERRHRELQEELAQLDAEVAKHKKEISSTSTLSSSMAAMTTGGGSGGVFQSTVRMPLPEPKKMQLYPQARVLGSAFKWKGVMDRSLKEEHFAWPTSKLADPVGEQEDYRFGGYPVTNTQYGGCSKECDLPGGSVFVEKGKTGFKKKR